MSVGLASKRFSYTLQADRDSKKPTVFTIKELTAIERGVMLDGFGAVVRMMALSETKDPTAEELRELRELSRSVRASRVDICIAGISEVSGVLDDAGKRLDMTVTQVINQIKDPADIEELSSAVLIRNTLNHEEKKSCNALQRSPDQAGAV